MLIDIESLSLLLSKILGLGLLVGGLFVKLPQIIKILGSGSATGLSLPGQTLESLSLAISAAYNLRRGHPFETFGETVFLLIQTSIIAVLVFLLSPVPLTPLKKLGITIGMMSITYCVLMYNVSVATLRLLFSYMSLPMLIYSRLLQIRTIHKNKELGNLSLITVSLVFLGSLARIFTSFRQLSDPTVISGACIAAFLNTAVLIQATRVPKKLKSS